MKAHIAVTHRCPVDCSLCQGGCHAITQALTGDYYAPGPKCPLIPGSKPGSKSSSDRDALSVKYKAIT